VQGAHGLNGDTLNGVNVSWWDESLGEKKTHLFYALKRIILPRQARDKHRGKLEKERRFLVGLGAPLVLEPEWMKTNE
jgi:hypothetical protein